MHISTLAGGVAMLLFAQSVQAEVVEQDERGFATRAVVQVEASPREAWMALIAPGKWWNSAHSWSGDAANMTIVPQAGGCFCEKIPESSVGDAPPLAGSVRHMVVLMAMPDRVLRMRGGLGPLQSEAADGVLTITLKPVAGGTQIVWEYVVGGYLRYEVPTIAKAVDGVMEEQVGRLADLLGRIAEPVPEAEVPTAPAAPTDEVPVRPSVDEVFGDLGA